MTEHIDPLRVIRDRLAEVAQPIGLELREMDVRVAAQAARRRGDRPVHHRHAPRSVRPRSRSPVDASIAEMDARCWSSSGKTGPTRPQQPEERGSSRDKEGVMLYRLQRPGASRPGV